MTRRAASPSQDQSRRSLFIGLGGIGSAGGGLLAVIAGVLLRQHYGSLVGECNSGIGQLSQAVNGEALRHCGLDGFLNDLGLIAILGGSLVLAVTVLAAVVISRGYGRNSVATSGRAPSDAARAPVAPRSSARRQGFWQPVARRCMLGLAMIGLALAGYLTYQHYGPRGVCISRECDGVPQWVYSFAGVPVSWIGIGGYAAILTSLLVGHGERSRRLTAALCIVGFVFSIYLTCRLMFRPAGESLWYLTTPCPLCLVSTIVMTLLVPLAGLRLLGTREPSARSPTSSLTVTAD